MDSNWSWFVDHSWISNYPASSTAAKIIQHLLNWISCFLDFIAGHCLAFLLMALISKSLSLLVGITLLIVSVSISWDHSADCSLSADITLLPCSLWLKSLFRLSFTIKISLLPCFFGLRSLFCLPSFDWDFFVARCLRSFGCLPQWLVLLWEVKGPVAEVECGKDNWEYDSSNDVDPLGPEKGDM